MNSALSPLLEQIAATSIAEWIAVVLAIAYVVLAARESIWCWLAAFCSTAIYIWLFWQVTLPFQAVLNVYYMVMAVYGYWQWHRQPGESKAITSWPLIRHVTLIVIVSIAAGLLGYLAATQFNGEYLWLDAAINIFSVVTTIMVAHKVLQNWLYWFVINSAAAFLYWQSGLVLSSLLFMGYVVFSIYGYHQWKQQWVQQSAS